MEDSDVREKPSITPEPTTDGGSEYASATGTPTKETFETPLNSGSSTETLQDVGAPGSVKEQGPAAVAVSRQPVAPAAQPYVPADLPKLLLRDPVEPNEVKLPLDDDDYVPPAPLGQTRTHHGESTPLLPSPAPQPRIRQGVRLSANNSDDHSCCTLL